MSALLLLLLAAAGLKPLGYPGSWVTADDYPVAALRVGEQGTAGFALAIGTDGMVTDCTITTSSGSAILDEQTCALMRQRARFEPAHDRGGRAIPARYSSRVTWQIPIGAPGPMRQVILDEVAGGPVCQDAQPSDLPPIDRAVCAKMVADLKAQGMLLPTTTAVSIAQPAAQAGKP